MPSGVAILGSSTSIVDSDTDDSSSDTSTFGAHSGTIVAVVLVILGIIILVVFSFALLRCYHIRQKSAYRNLQGTSKAPHRYVHSMNVTPRIETTMELQNRGLLGDPAPPPSYIDAMSAQGSPALSYCPSPSISRSASPALLYPHSPILFPRTPSTPPPAASSPLMEQRRF